MFYIVTEDKNSARSFWEMAVKTFKEKGTYELVDLPDNKKNDTKNGGNTTLKTQVSALMPRLKEYDTLFVAFDNIGDTSTFNPKSFLKSTREWCEKKKINFMYTTYYCFEEIYLSYDELILLFPKHISRYKYILDTLKYVNNCTNNHKDYYNNNSIVQGFINSHPDAGKNREHFANQLLVNTTQLMSNGGHFSIVKDGSAFEAGGICWITSCSEIQKEKHPKAVENLCGKKCEYSCKNKNAKEKLLDLNSRSLFRKSKIQLYEMEKY